MTRDETVALFEACEAKRREARAAALAEGKSEDDAEPHRARGREGALERLGRAPARRTQGDGGGQALGRGKGPDLGKTPKPAAWMEKAAADFSRCLFLLRGGKGPKRQREKKERQRQRAACQINPA